MDLLSDVFCSLQAPATAVVSKPLVRAAHSLLRRLNADYQGVFNGQPILTDALLPRPSTEGLPRSYAQRVAMKTVDRRRTLVLLCALFNRKLVRAEWSRDGRLLWVPMAEHWQAPDEYTDNERMYAACCAAINDFIESIARRRGPRQVDMPKVNEFLHLAGVDALPEEELVRRIEPLLPTALYIAGHPENGRAITVRSEHTRDCVPHQRHIIAADGTVVFHADHVLHTLSDTSPLLLLRRGEAAHALIRKTMREETNPEARARGQIRGTSIAVVGPRDASIVVTSRALLPAATLYAYDQALPDLLPVWERHHGMASLPSGLPREMEVSIAARSFGALIALHRAIESAVTRDLRLTHPDVATRVSRHATAVVIMAAAWSERFRELYRGKRVHLEVPFTCGPGKLTAKPPAWLPISYTARTLFDDDSPTPLGAIHPATASWGWCVPHLVRWRESDDPARSVLATGLLAQGIHRVDKKTLLRMAREYLHEETWAAGALALFPTALNRSLLREERVGSKTAAVRRVALRLHCSVQYHRDKSRCADGAAMRAPGPALR